MPTPAPSTDRAPAAADGLKGHTAAATAERFFLCDELDHRPPEDPERTFAIFMCAYARDIHAGILPGHYTDQDARRYARACLIPTELAERHDLDVEHSAAALQVPVDELRAAQADATAQHANAPTQA